MSSVIDSVLCHRCSHPIRWLLCRDAVPTLPEAEATRTARGAVPTSSITLFRADRVSYARRMNSSPMARTLGILSAVLLVLGATGPLAKAMLMNAYLGDVSPTRVTLLVLIAGAAVACSLMGKTGWLAVTSLAAIGTLGSLAISTGEKTYIPVVSEALNLITDALTSLFTDFAKAVVNLQWGGFCLVGGILLMLLVGLIWRKY